MKKERKHKPQPRKDEQTNFDFLALSSTIY